MNEDEDEVEYTPKRSDLQTAEDPNDLKGKAQHAKNAKQAEQQTDIELRRTRDCPMLMQEMARAPEASHIYIC